MWEAPHNDFAHYAMHHSQRAIPGLIHDLCLAGTRLGEPAPGDRRLRFRGFVFVGDREAMRRTGARYLLLHRRTRAHVGPAYQDARCLRNLEALYGPPVEIDERLAVFELSGAREGSRRASEPPEKMRGATRPVRQATNSSEVRSTPRP